jgi:predicted enzyme related to lactoylglutathione lyase
VTSSPIQLVEFPADDPARARRFWEGVLSVTFAARESNEGSGWKTHAGPAELGVHERGTGPGDRFSLAYFSVPDLQAAMERVRSLGGEIIHPGERWAICRDSEGSPFGLMHDAE